MVVRLAREWDDTSITYRAPRRLIKEFGRRKLQKIIDYIISDIKGTVIKKRKIHGAYEYLLKKKIANIEFSEEVSIIEPYGIFVYIYFRNLK